MNGYISKDRSGLAAELRCDGVIQYVHIPPSHNVYNPAIPLAVGVFGRV